MTKFTMSTVYAFTVKKIFKLFDLNLEDAIPQKLMEDLQDILFQEKKLKK